MKRIEINLEVKSSSLSLAQISKELNCEASQSSHEKGSLRIKGDCWSHSIWKSERKRIEELEFEKAMLSFLRQPFISNLKRKRSLQKSCTSFIDICVFYDTAMCTLDLSAKVMSEIGKKKLRVICSCYPVESPPKPPLTP
jgi:hypothetical protein